MASGAFSGFRERIGRAFSSVCWRGIRMADNRVVVYKGPGEVAVENIDYPKLEVPQEVADAVGMSVAAPHAVF